jgi:hypothetical protein
MEEQAGGGVSGNCCGAIFAAVEKKSAESKVESAFGGFAAMAIEAPGFEDGAYLAFEGDRRSGFDSLGWLIGLSRLGSG